MLRIGVVAAMLSALAAGTAACERVNAEAPAYDAVIYGGGPQAVAAAAMAAATGGPDTRILMIVPENRLGSTMSVGRQNLFDLNYYRPSRLPDGLPAGYEGTQGGTLHRLVRELGAVFPPDAMADALQRLIPFSQVKVLYETDLTAVELEQDSRGARTIRAIRHQRLGKGTDGRLAFTGEESGPVPARVFLDASETGRLLRLTGAPYDTGREDSGSDQLQMVATLMYQLRGANAYKAVEPNKSAYGTAYSTKGSFQFWAGREAYQLPELVAYDRTSPFFRLKAYNAGEDGYSHVGADTSATRFWMNHLIIYNVDARKMWRDKLRGSSLYPDSAGLDPEEARELAVAELKRPAFWAMLRKLPGLERAEPVLRPDGEPETGEMLYLRESIHARGADPRHALTKADVLEGGERFYARRIGLGFYNFDSNTYRKDEALTNPLHEPWYVPYEALRTPYVDNLLLPGYAANIDSYAWTAMRVYPNLILLGDAAGAAAGLALRHGFDLREPSLKELEALQAVLVKHQAILEK